jgi:hypothetical protein
LPVLETVTIVLEFAGGALRVREVHAATEKLLGTRVRRTSVKAALAAGTTGPSPAFKRVRTGVYRSTR